MWAALNNTARPPASWPPLIMTKKVINVPARMLRANWTVEPTEDLICEFDVRAFKKLLMKDIK